MFDNIYGQAAQLCFRETWLNCNLLAQSVENILVSIDSASITPFSADGASLDNRIDIKTKLDEVLTPNTITAISSLKTKLWNIEINGVLQ